MRDSRTMTDQLNDCGDTGVLDVVMRQRMQKLVCANAKGRSTKQKVADATELMMMLGIHPKQVDDYETNLPPSTVLNHFHTQL